MRKKKTILASFLFLPLMGGCSLLGFLLSPSASEQSVPARFPLTEHKDKSIYLLVRSAPGRGVDVDVPELLSRAIAKQLRQKVKIEDDLIYQAQHNGAHPPFSWTQAEQDARQAGAAFLLYVEIIDYELIPLQQKDYYMGSLTTRSLLLDTNTGQAVWPEEESGHLAQAAVDFEKKGRSEILWRLVTAASHCIVREFYNCSKPAYWVGDEVKPLDTYMNDLD